MGDIAQQPAVNARHRRDRARAAESVLRRGSPHDGARSAAHENEAGVAARARAQGARRQWFTNGDDQELNASSMRRHVRRELHARRPGILRHLPGLRRSVYRAVYPPSITAAV